MVPPRIDLHVGACTHMAFDAASARRVLFVVMMRTGVVARLVALQAEIVAFGDEFQRVRVVAMGATHSLGVHAALEKGAQHVDLVENLAVGGVEAFSNQFQGIAVVEGLAGRRFGVDPSAA